MGSHAGRTRNSWKKYLLVTAGVAALAVFGALTGPLLAQSSASQSPATSAPTAQSLEAMEAAGIKMEFDVASVKQNKSSEQPYSKLSLRSWGCLFT